LEAADAAGVLLHFCHSGGCLFFGRAISEVDCRLPGTADDFVPRCWDGSILMHDFDKSMKDAVRYF
jgi:hypothetical protein